MAGFDAVPSIVLAGIVAGVVAVPAALIVFRLRGAYFAIGTWVVAEVCRLVLAQVKQLGGGTGTSLPTDVAGAMLGLDQVARAVRACARPAARDILAYWLALLLAAGTFVLVYRLLRSRHGLALAAIRDAEAAAESVGVDVFRTKLLIYVVTAFGDRHGRRAHLPAEGEDLARRGVLASSIGRPMSSSSSSSAASARWKARSSAC